MNYRVKIIFYINKTITNCFTFIPSHLGDDRFMILLLALSPRRDHLLKSFKQSGKLTQIKIRFFLLLLLLSVMTWHHGSKFTVVLYRLWRHGRFINLFIRFNYMSLLLLIMKVDINIVKMMGCFYDVSFIDLWVFIWKFRLRISWRIEVIK